MKDFLFTLFAWLFTLPLIVGAVVFAVYNPVDVTITFNPFQDPVTVPVYLPVLTAIAFGFLFGALMTWAGMGRQRAELREAKKRIKTLEKQIDENARTPVPANNYAMLPSSFIEKH